MTERDFSETFDDNFLVNVACELRFIPLLEIQNKISVFQKKIRDEFPVFAIRDSFKIGSPTVPPSQWIFKSQDENKTIRVGINRISIAVDEYSEFREFYDLVSDLFTKFQKTYKIDNYVRAGIRFTNIMFFDEQENKNPSESVRNLFKPLINNERITNYDFFGINTNFRWKEEGNKVIVKNELIIDDDDDYHYVIDIDSYTEEHFKFESIETIFAKLNKFAVREFYDNITDKFIENLRSL